jgi:murein L,D-transpeptidase YafK
MKFRATTIQMRMTALAMSAAALVLSGVAARHAGAEWAQPGQELFIWKSRRLMVLREGDEIVRRFEIVLGIEPDDPKLRRGDNRTPEGTYFVSEKQTQPSFRRFLGLSYPNVSDAERALHGSLISQEEWADILFANLRGETPPWNTRLGGRIGIHGYGDRPELNIDWTKGCIAVRNDDIEYLYARIRIGTQVHIKE